MDRDTTRLATWWRCVAARIQGGLASPLELFTALSLLALLLYVIVPILNWAFFAAVWVGPVSRCHTAGACWVYVGDNVQQLLFGLYPQIALWRLYLSLGLMLLWLGLLFILRSWRSQLALWLFVMLCAPVMVYALLYGGWADLPVVATSNWGGLCLNILFTWLSIAYAFPLGCVLAVVRHHRWGIYSLLARVLIDCIRGLPLVSLLFFASFVLPFFFADFDGSVKLLRLWMIFTVFAAAYMAEAMRAGIQSVTKSQFEAAAVLGLRPAQTWLWVVFPQALEVAFPSLVNLVIALLKDSTLLSTIAVLDMVGMMQATTARVAWMPYAIEAYVFVGAVFWFLCNLIAWLARYVETRLAIAK